MLPTVHSLLPSHDQAHDILRRLQSAGIPDSDISYVRYQLEEPSPTNQPAKEAETNTDTPGDKVAGGTATGAVAGAAAGLGVMSIVGLTPLLIIAPAVITAGAAIGAAAGTAAAINALDDFGVPEAERKDYENTLRDGGALVAVRSEDESLLERARGIIEEGGGKARVIRLTKKLD